VVGFSDDEIAFLHSPDRHYLQKTAYFATVSSDGQPDVVPVGFEFDGTYIYIGGANQLKSRKYRNVLAGNTKVSFAYADHADVEPWTPSWLRVYGTADIVEREGSFGPGSYIRITPEISWSFNMERNVWQLSEGAKPFKRPGAIRRTVHSEQGVA
jgi:pyridoxamine 5'-phosphate oxidase family protein